MAVAVAGSTTGQGVGVGRAAAALLALACAAGGLFLALHHPLGAGLALGLLLALGVAAWRWSAVPLTLLPALLPVLGLAPWTGWLTVEEFDLLLLAGAAGAYARIAWPAPLAEEARAWRWPPVSILAWLLLGLMALSVLLSLQRGAADAGGWVWGWTQGYREPMNSLRLAKPLFAALLWWPLWRAACRQGREAAETALLRGLTLGLAGCALAALWERAAFTELLNFSSDYRTTALFWEMHVGGAALDGYLALTLPFAVQLALNSRRRLDLGLALTTLVLAGYAALTTFSRIVYLALPAGLLLMGGLLLQQRLRGADAGARRLLWLQLLPAVLLMIGFALGAGVMFVGAGYRGLLALFGAVLLMLPLAHEVSRFRVAEWSAGLALGAVGGALAVAGALVLPKGAYIVYGLCLLWAAGMLAWQLRRRAAAAARPHPPSTPAALALAGFIATLVSAVLVAAHWGEDRGLAHAWPVALLVFLTLVVAARRPQGLWPASLRWQGLLAAAMVAVAAVVAVFGGGAYMAGRLSASQGDLSGREDHWRRGVELLRTTEQQLLGVGLGRYLDHFAVAAGPGERPGDYRHRAADGKGWLVLTAGNHLQSWGEILRVSQRVDRPQGRSTVQFEARVAQPVVLHFNVCKKHLLYDDGGCQVKSISIPATGGAWQTFSTPLDGGPMPPDPWYLPRFVMFSIGNEAAGLSVDVDKLSLRDEAGRELLHNGGFEDRGRGGLERWFFSSDRNHLPWHAKNLQVHLLVEQGALGLLAFMLLWLAALWRVTLGSARALPLAPPLAAALLGFMVVGLVDSLLDMPRVAWQYHALVLVALTLQQPWRSRRGPARESGTPGV